MKKEILSLSLATVMGFSGVLMPMNAEAESEEILKVSQQEKHESTFSQEDLSKVEQNLFQMGTDQETVEKLIKKLKNGEVLDADILDYKDAVDKLTKIVGDTTTITYVYPDGSRAQAISEQIEVENLPEGLTPVERNSEISTRSVSGGSCTGGSGYTVCSGRKVSRQYATYGYSFYAGYQLVNGGYDKISSAGKWNIWTAGGTATLQKMRIIRSTENVSNNAEARLSANINLANSAGTITRSLSLHVGDNKAWDTWNQYY